jgi:DNA-binding transcriptional LysR family regulator
VDLLRDGVDLAIRAGATPPDSPNVRARKLAIIDRVLCASPAFVAKHRVVSIDSLARVPCVVQGNSTQWTFEPEPMKSACVVAVHGRFRTNSITALREAILGSVGVGRLPLWIAHDDLRRRRLVRVLPEFTLPPLEVFGMYHLGSRGSVAIHAALDFLARELPSRTKMRRVKVPGARP